MAEDPVFKRLRAIDSFRGDHDKLESVIGTTFSK